VKQDEFFKTGPCYTRYHQRLLPAIYSHLSYKAMSQFTRAFASAEPQTVESAVNATSQPLHQAFTPSYSTEQNESSTQATFDKTNATPSFIIERPEDKREYTEGGKQAENRRDYHEGFAVERKTRGLPRFFRCEGVRLDGSTGCPYNQEFLPASQSAREGVSDFFGGNKPCFQQIPKHLRFLMCRKCYQHSRFNNPQYQQIKLIYIEKMLDRIEQLMPTGKYFVTLHPRLYKKYKEYLDALECAKEEHEAWESGAVAKLVDEKWFQQKVQKDDERECERNRQNKKPRDIVPCDVVTSPIFLVTTMLRLFGSADHYDPKDPQKSRPDKSRANVISLIDCMHRWLAEGRIPMIIPFEIMPEIQSPDVRDAWRHMLRSEISFESNGATKRSLDRTTPSSTNADEGLFDCDESVHGPCRKKRRLS